MIEKLGLTFVGVVAIYCWYHLAIEIWYWLHYMEILR